MNGGAVLNCLSDTRQHLHVLFMFQAGEGDEVRLVGLLDALEHL
jgi:hypothetical protein